MKYRNPSPLRYPGGKSSLSGFLESIIYANELQGCTYVEPYAGGAGAALKLLRGGHVDRIVINDADRSIFCFWNAVMKHTASFVDRIYSIPLTMKEWRRQKEIYSTPARRPHLDVGFAAFYLNRCNRSGIIMNGGPIGGMQQSGKWKLDVRFNRDDLAARVEEVSSYGDRIVVLQQDAITLIRNLWRYVGRGPNFLYADPPYYSKGRALYLSYYKDADHVHLSRVMIRKKTLNWVMSYDDVPRIRELYSKMNIRSFWQRYSVHSSSLAGGEVLISPSHVEIPQQASLLLAGIHQQALRAA
jgi:DNA adenine methylase